MQARRAANPNLIDIGCARIHGQFVFDSHLAADPRVDVNRPGNVGGLRTAKCAAIIAWQSIPVVGVRLWKLFA